MTYDDDDSALLDIRATAKQNREKAEMATCNESTARYI